MKVFSLSVILLLLTSSIAWCQLTQYSPTPDKFQEEIVEQLTTAPKELEDEVEIIQVEFVSAWNSGYYNIKTQKDIIATANVFLKRRIRFFPFLKNYLKQLILFQKHNVDKQGFEAWAKSFHESVQNNRLSTAQLQFFMDFTTGFLEHRNLFDNKSTQWIASTQDFEFIYDSIFKVRIPETKLLGRLNLKIPDSTVIYDTKGELWPWEKQWFGSGGTVRWERAGLKKDEVYATLKEYKIDLQKVSYDAENVTFYNSNYTSQPVEGKLHERVLAGTSGDAARYPKFDSYQQRFELKNIFEDVDYSGGFSMYGSRFVGTGTRENPAVITIKKNSTPFILASSLAFTILKDNFNSIATKVKMVLGEDSISHPGLTFKYNDSTKVVAMIRRRKGAEKVKFTNSYHKLKMDVEFVKWTMGTDSVIFRSLPGSPRTEASYTSIDYFNIEEFQKMQGMDNKHPLLALSLFVDKWGDNAIPVKDFAIYLSKPQYQIRQLFTLLSYEGFVGFKEGDEEAVVNEQLFEYLKSRRRAILDQVKGHLNKYNRDKKVVEQKLKEFVEESTKDYDIIKINSNNPSIIPSGILNLSSLDLNITGVDSVPLSLKYRTRTRTFVDKFGDSIQMQVKEPKPITINPIDRKLVLQKNRDFFYNGILKVEAFSFHGRNFRFKYDDFKVNLDSIDYLSLTVWDPDEEDYKKVLHVIEDIKGDVVLDSATNKSGTVELPEYPIFNSTEVSKIYYDDDNIMEVTYPKESFYVSIDPYTIDSLLDFTAERWKQKGFFKAGGIVADFSETIIIRKDSTDQFGDPEMHYSFGFKKQLDEGGTEVYGGKGKLFQELNLSMKGLQGNGRLDYAASTMESDNFLFAIDSMNARTKNFIVSNEGEHPSKDVPNVSSPETKVVWMHRDDELFSESVKDPFHMYKDLVVMPDSALMRGRLKVKPNTLSGEGTITFARSSLTSNSFMFQAKKLNSDSTEFNLRSKDSEKSVFGASNVSSLVNMVGKTAIFTSKDNSIVKFPENQYMCYMDQFVWNFKDEQKIDISSKKQYKDVADASGADEALLVGSQFISTNPLQDSLRFVSGKSTFDPEKMKIIAEDVRLIRVADATVYPSEPVIIFKGARMDTLKSAEIVAPSKERHHRFFNSEAKILGRHSYKAIGDYEYRDENEDMQTVHFDTIRVNDDLQTVGHGYVPDSTGFMLSPHFAFFGDVNLTASDSLLTFNGYTELRHNSVVSNPLTWIKFKSRIQPTDIRIEIQEKPISKHSKAGGNLLNRPDIMAGYLLTRDSAHIYTNFLTRPITMLDAPVLSALPNARESLKVTKIGVTGKQKEALEVKKEESKESKDSTAVAEVKPEEDLTNPTDTITSQATVAVKDSTVSLKLDGDIYIPPNDTISFLVFDKKSQSYIITRSEKLEDPSLPGNLIRLHKKNGISYGEGLMSLAPNLNTLRHIAAGTIEHNINTNKIELNVALGVDFILPSAALDLIIDELYDAVGMLPVDFASDKIQRRFTELLGKENAKQTLESLSLGIGTSVPEQLSRSFLFNDVKLVWNTEKHSYSSVGQLGLNNIGSEFINKYINGHMSVEHSSRGDVVNIYIKVPGGSFYFFTYSKDMLRAYSSNPDFNAIMEMGKPKDRRFKTSFGIYTFGLSSQQSKNGFVRQFMDYK